MVDMALMSASAASLDGGMNGSIGDVALISSGIWAFKRGCWSYSDSSSSSLSAKVMAAGWMWSPLFRYSLIASPSWTVPSVL